MKLGLVLLMTLLSSSIFAFKITTYNVGLAHTFVPLAKERTPALIEAMKKSESDVLCLQEVWEKKDRKKIIKELKKQYPFVHYTKIEKLRSKRKPTCKISDLFGKGKFVSCMQKQCKDLDGDDFTNCIINKCDQSLKDLRTNNRECATGLMSQVGKSTIAALAAVLNPFVGAELFSYGGGNGLLLLSKKELKDKDLIDMTDISTLTRRGALTAEVEGRSILCTHLTANLEKTAPYTGTFNGWGSENKAQVERILGKFENDNRPTYLAGDFNCGLPVPDLDIPGDFMESCQIIIDNEYKDHLLNNNPACTHCSDNTLNDGADDVAGDLIDHVFTKNVDVVNSRRVYTNLVEIKVKKETETTNLSDHYGVEIDTL